MYKLDLVMSKTQPGQICITKACYDSLASQNIHQLIRVTDQIRTDNDSAE